MDAFEYDPEGTILRQLVQAVPGLVEMSRRYCDALDSQPDVQCHDFGSLMPRAINQIACAYNNLNTIYDRRFPRWVAPTRFVWSCTTDARDFGVCPEHQAQQVACFYGRSRNFAFHTNDFTVGEDIPAGRIPTPRRPELRMIVRAFEAYVGFRKTLRVCEVVRAGGGSLLLVQYREFTTVAQYEYALTCVGDRIRACMAATLRQPLCVGCCPCIATLMFCQLGAPTDAGFVLKYPDGRDQEFFMADPRPGAEVLAGPRVRKAGLVDVQNALLWYFAGCSGPMLTLFAVATALREPSLAQGLELVQEVALYAYMAYKQTPADARRKQQEHVLPRLKQRQLYDPVNDVVVITHSDFNPTG